MILFFLYALFLHLFLGEKIEEIVNGNIKCGFPPFAGIEEKCPGICFHYETYLLTYTETVWDVQEQNVWITSTYTSEMPFWKTVTAYKTFTLDFYTKNKEIVTIESKYNVPGYGTTITALFKEYLTETPASPTKTITFPIKGVKTEHKIVNYYQDFTVEEYEKTTTTETKTLFLYSTSHL